MDVSEVGYIYHQFSNDKCEGTPLVVGFYKGNQCSQKETHFCQAGVVKAFKFNEVDCSGTSTTFENRYPLGVCVRDYDGLYRKVIHCGNDPFVPDWVVIASATTVGLVITVVLVFIGIIFLYCNVIRKGGYWNPIIEDEDIPVGYSEI
jgi:hypothetical protein